MNATKRVLHAMKKMSDQMLVQRCVGVGAWTWKGRWPGILKLKGMLHIFVWIETAKGKLVYYHSFGSSPYKMTHQPFLLFVVKVHRWGVKQFKYKPIMKKHLSPFFSTIKGCYTAIDIIALCLIYVFALDILLSSRSSSLLYWVHIQEPKQLLPRRKKIIM